MVFAEIINTFSGTHVDADDDTGRYTTASSNFATDELKSI